MTAETTQAEIECLCPFCGAFNSVVGEPCARCATLDSGDSREAAKAQFGPWAVLSVKNPAAPGMSFAALQSMIRRGEVTERSIVRGPTTGQLWRLASKVRGLSREFGACYNCGGDVDAETTRCPACDRLQTLPESAPVRAETTQREVLAKASSAEAVMAERPARKIPKEDLLQPKDIAKAFQLSFGVPSVSEFLSDEQPTKTRRIKIAFGVVGTVMTVALLAPLAAAVMGRAESATTAGQPPVIAVALPAAKLAAPLSVSGEARLAASKVDAPVEAEPSVVVISPKTVEPAVTGSASDPMKLWRQAITAENRGQYATAVKLYRQIESLPGDAWPAQLQTRLKRARVELASSAR